MTTRNQCDDAIREYRKTYRSEWLLAAWAIAGGCIGAVLVLATANSVFLTTLLGH